MKRFILALFVTLHSCAFAQSFVSFKYSQIYSNFYFRDRNGQADESLKADMRTGYGIDFKKLVHRNIYIGSELWYKNFGPMSYLNNQKLDWNLHYLDLNLGAGYILNYRRIKPYIGASFYGAYLFKANQTIGVNYFDIIENKSIKRMDFGFNLNGGVQYAFSDVTSVFFEVMYTRGLKNLEVDTEEKLFNTAICFRFGLTFLIEKGESNYNYIFRN
jgi:hypothetical protein